MAGGVTCKYCGFQETSHLYDVEERDVARKRKKGYKVSLNKCKGFTPNKKDRAYNDEQAELAAKDAREAKG